MSWSKWLIALFSILSAYAANARISDWEPLGEVISTQKFANGIELQTKGAQVRIQEYQPGIIRVRVNREANWPKDFSWAVTGLHKSKAHSLLVNEQQDMIELQTSQGYVQIEKSRLKITFLNSERKVLLADASPMTFNGSQFRVIKSMPLDEHFYGLGDKPGSIDHRGQSYQNWNTDVFGWQESTDPLYKTIPFYLTMRKGQSYGLFLDNTWRSYFDFGRNFKDKVVFGADGGELNYYFIYGPHPKAVIQKYSSLVGTMPLPPMWTLGYQQCRWSYDTEARVREVSSLLRKHEIPTDVIYLDIDFQKGNAPFTIDETKFPHFDSMVSDLRQQGIRTIAITDLHLKKEAGYKPYDEGVAGDHLLKKTDGTLYVGDVWPGPSVFPDFTLSRVRSWWGSLYADFVQRGVAGFWNDMNEPAIFNVPSKTMPEDVVHRMDDGTSQSHEAIHNVYGMQNVRATYEGLLKLQPEERPFVLTRAAYAGTHRYAATWTGDNTSSWNHLRLMTPTLLTLGLSGYALAGADIGGFVGSPTPELLTRWIELGVFTPMFRNHTMKGSANQEPWVHGEEHLKIRKKYIELRYRLMPYIYTLMEEAARTGIPVMRPVFLEFPEAEKFYTEPLNGLVQQYLFGPDLLVIPKVVEMTDPALVSMPPGQWYNYWTGDKVQGGKDIFLNPALDSLPLFVRAGAVIPLQPLVQSTAETPKGPLELHVYPGANCGTSVYFDDGASFKYRQGEYARLKVECEEADGKIKINVHALKGTFVPWWNNIKLVVYGIDSASKRVTIDGREISNPTYESKAKALSIEMEKPKASVQIVIE